MASRREIVAVYLAAVVQGIVLVAFPAVAAIFTSPAHYALSATAYGGIFIPQAITAVLASLLGAGLARQLGGKRVLLVGLGADLLSMALLFVSQFAEPTLAYGLLLGATGFLGIGFGFVVPALNTFTAAFFPTKIDTAVLMLNALLGLGTALAPAFAVVFVGFGFWWGLPVLMTGLCLALLLFAWRLPLKENSTASKKSAKTATVHSLPPRFWLYAAFALVYGICETLNANWATVYLAKGLGASVTLASMALTVFWVSVTGGRLLFAAIEKFFAPSLTYRLLPLFLALVFVALATTPRSHPILAILLFGAAGLGCSALLPLVISFGQRELTSMAASVAGGLIGFYQIGYGVAAFGVGPLQSWAGLSLGAIYGWTSLVAVALAALAFVIVAAPKSAR
jgi:fucose permease